MANNEIQFILYTMPDDEGKVQVVIKDETLWCTQKAMAQLFGCSTDNIGLHLKNIFNEGELDKDSVTEKFSATASDGKNYQTQFYKLDAIIAVGYRVSSLKATRFRQWATKPARTLTARQKRSTGYSILINRSIPISTTS